MPFGAKMYCLFVHFAILRPLAVSVYSFGAEKSQTALKINAFYCRLAFCAFRDYKDARCQFLDARGFAGSEKFKALR